MQGAHLNNMVMYVVLLCALVTTGLVVRREFVSDSQTVQAIPSEPTFLKDWREALQHGILTGPAQAPVQVVEFADFQCPYCAQFEKRLSEVSRRHAEKLAITFVHSPLPSHGHAEAAARAAECAHAQGQFNAMKAILFEQQGSFGALSWAELGRQAKVPNVELFQACVDSTQPIERVVQGTRLASKFGVRGTPTILVNGWLLPRPPSADEFDRIVREVLKGETPKLK